MPAMPTKEKRQEMLRALEGKIADKKGIGAVYGLAKGLSITMKTMLRPAITQQYPHVKPDLPARTRGVIALKEENCTVCMLCSRECPDWCIYIDSHKEQMAPKAPGARARTRNVLDRFAIDYALCMYCGICVEVCPFDALFWSPHFEYSTVDIDEMTHEMDTLGDWMALVPPPPPLDVGSEDPVEMKAEAKAYGMPAAAAAPAAPAQPAAPAEPGAPAEPDAPPAKGPEPSAAGAAPDSATTVGAPTGPADTQTEAQPQETGLAGQDEAVPAPEEHEAPQIDQETYDRLIGEGKSDREARAMAKKAWVIKRRKGQG